MTNGRFSYTRISTTLTDAIQARQTKSQGDMRLSYQATSENHLLATLRIQPPTLI